MLSIEYVNKRVRLFRPEFQFLWKGPLDGPVPLKRRRIAAKRLRGEWSEGLLMPTTSLPEFGNVPSVVMQVPDETTYYRVREGDDVAAILGITHYDPPEEGENSGANAASTTGGRSKFPRSFRGWVNFVKMYVRGERREGGPANMPTYDVDAFKKYTDVFKEGENVIVTEKIHGSNARYTYVKGFFGYGHMYAGSRNLWKSLGSNCAWRRALKDNPWIESWCKAHPGYGLYGEITPTQKGYDYGSNGKVRFFLFDIRDPKGNWVSREDSQELIACSGISITLREVSVPLFYRGDFNIERIKQFVDGPTAVSGATGIREGIVIKAQPDRYDRNVGRVQLKIVSNAFLEKDSK